MPEPTRHAGLRRAVIGLLVLLALAALGAAGWLFRDELSALLDAPGDGNESTRPPPLVETAPAELRRVEARISATGTLEAPEAVIITADSPGRVAAVLFEEGTAVAAGEPLLRLERERAAARVEEARAQLAEKRQDLARMRELRGEQFVSPAELERAEAAAESAAAALTVAEEDLGDREIEAPFAGVIGRRHVSVGALLDPGTPVADLRRVDPLDLLLDVPETALGRIAAGQRVTATTPAYPERTFTGEVSFIGTALDTATRTLPLKATLPNPDRLLRPGMFMRAAVVTGERELVTVPEAAVIARGPTEHLFVLVPGDDGAPPTVTRRQVATGLRRAGWVAIERGVDADEQVVVGGLAALRDGATVRTGPPDAAAGSPESAGAQQPGAREP
ncbi:efflux RND transporter periplasmic adaptor subunit [Thiohalocapsa sp. ML1]|uniref:efflux RND transporter periplasmic adaptor subunit n=1 Tax=Thiohalocapsa sp. ML1 TaxID=1431688 RepID=UPI000731EEDD|nr:efflux RND transporter periplasmic adaptor subunit [Thiohalocapsa sp. ML1]